MNYRDFQRDRIPQDAQDGRIGQKIKFTLKSIYRIKTEAQITVTASIVEMVMSEAKTIDTEGEDSATKNNDGRYGDKGQYDQRNNPYLRHCICSICIVRVTL